MNKQLLKDALGWGFGLWFIGYVLGFIFFFIVSPSLIGWFVTPLGVIITLWVLLKKVKGETLGYYFTLAITWTIIAIAFDYVFMVKMLNPVGGYYKLDIYLYYALTFALPLVVFWWKKRK